jgi:hypothetical protein
MSPKIPAEGDPCEFALAPWLIPSAKLAAVRLHHRDTAPLLCIKLLGGRESLLSTGLTMKGYEVPCVPTVCAFHVVRRAAPMPPKPFVPAQCIVIFLVAVIASVQ